MKRRIGVFIVRESGFPAKDVDRVLVVNTGKGSALRLQFKSGRKKTLTMSLGNGGIDDATAILNEFLYTPKPG